MRGGGEHVLDVVLVVSWVLPVRAAGVVRADETAGVSRRRCQMVAIVVERHCGAASAYDADSAARVDEQRAVDECAEGCGDHEEEGGRVPDVAGAGEEVVEDCQEAEEAGCQGRQEEGVGLEDGVADCEGEEAS